MNKRYYEHTLSTTREFIEYLLFKMYLSAVLTFESSIPLLNDTGL